MWYEYFSKEDMIPEEVNIVLTSSINNLVNNDLVKKLLFNDKININEDLIRKIQIIEKLLKICNEKYDLKDDLCKKLIYFLINRTRNIIIK
jgi:hypothetical protein